MDHRWSSDVLDRETNQGKAPRPAPGLFLELGEAKEAGAGEESRGPARCEPQSKPQEQPREGSPWGTAGYVGETDSRVERGPVSDQKEAAVFLHPRPGPRVLGWRQLRQRCVPVSSLGFQTALPAPTPEHAYGPPCSFLLKHQQRKQTIKEGKVPLEQPPMTAIINVCKSKQLRLPLEQTTSSPRQHHSKGNYSKQNQRTC